MTRILTNKTLSVDLIGNSGGISTGGAGNASITTLGNTTTNLTVPGGFLSSNFDVSTYIDITGTLVCSNQGTLTLRWSMDGGTNYDGEEDIAYTALDLLVFRTPVLAPDFRIFFDPSVTPTTTLRLYWAGRQY